jgi:hypothetical protein
LFALLVGWTTVTICPATGTAGRCLAGDEAIAEKAVHPRRESSPFHRALIAFVEFLSCFLAVRLDIWFCLTLDCFC